jgi:hypothetical protein
VDHSGGGTFIGGLGDGGCGHSARPKETRYVQNRTVSRTILDEDIHRNERAARDRYYNQVFDVKTLREFSAG